MHVLHITGKIKSKDLLADNITDKPWATDFSHSLAVTQDVQDAIKALVHLQLSEFFDISFHNKKLTWKKRSPI